MENKEAQKGYLKNQNKQINKSKLIDTENKLMVARWKGGQKDE